MSSGHGAITYVFPRAMNGFCLLTKRVGECTFKSVEDMYRTVYMDNNATTPMADEVKAVMEDNLSLYGNASSMHALGRNAYSGIDWARRMCADLIACQEDEIYFTSGASESNNTVFNIARDLIDGGSGRNRIVTTTIEHPSIIELVKYLRGKGYRIDEAPVDASGMVKLDDMKALMVQNRTVGLIENGSWAPASGKLIRLRLEEMKNMTLLEPTVTLKSSLKEDSRAQLEALKDAIVASLNA